MFCALNKIPLVHVVVGGDVRVLLTIVDSLRVGNCSVVVRAFVAHSQCTACSIVSRLKGST